jgi:very-short-patch-repair endonuclease
MTAGTNCPVFRRPIFTGALRPRICRLSCTERAANPTLIRVEATAAVAAYGGAARWKRLIDKGVTDGRLRASVRSGELVQRGSVYAFPDAASDVVVAAQLGGRLTCSSATSRLGLDTLNPPKKAHVAVAHNNSRTHKGAILHRTGHGPGWLVSVPEALVHALGCLPLVDALVVVDSGLRKKRVCISDLRNRIIGPDSVRRRGLLDLADGKAGSVIETVARLAIRSAGLPVQSQVYIPDVGRVDLVIDGWLVIEIDGYAHHSSRDQFRNDRRRANLLAEKGFQLLRFSYEDVMHRTAQMVGQICVIHASR